jgi:hypothetical protein
VSKDDFASTFERQAFGSFTHKGFSPDRALLDIVQGLDDDNGLLTERERDRLVELARHFIETHPDPTAGAPLADYRPGQGRELIREIDRKRGSIAQAVVDLGR